MEKTIGAMKRYTYIYIASLLVALLGCSESGDGGGNVMVNSGKGGSMARFAAQGDYLYAVTETSLKVFDISSAGSPQYLPGKEQRLTAGAETIFPMDSLLFIGSQSGMYIYSISRPNFPQQISQVSHITSCDPVVASGKYAYVTLNSGAARCWRGEDVLNIYDISDIYAPELKHTERGFTHPMGLGIDGERLYICDNGLKVYDISNPLKPAWIGDLTHIAGLGAIQTYDVIPLASSLLLTGEDGIYQLDCSGEKLSLISKIEVTRK
ncbi:MAG: hypothetical protein LBH04_11120 [Tannerellaceae bacterium]|jgi:hypothetical protein|nr:hypothetical protein [Tannerellaceae bacterium]